MATITGFSVIKDHNSKSFKKVAISSITVARGDLLENVGGATTWTACTATSNYFSRKAIAQEAATTAATSILVRELDGTETVMAETAADTSASHNGDAMVLTDSNTVNNSGTTATTQYVAFYQDGTIGATGSRLIYGRVCVGNGVDPDATT
jgi:hypothetical protein